MDQLWLEWKPDYSLDDVVALCQKRKDCPDISRVLQAWELIAWEHPASTPSVGVARLIERKDAGGVACSIFGAKTCAKVEKELT